MLHTDIKRKCTTALTTDVIISHGNANTGHTALLVLDQPAYSLEQSPCDFHVFGPLKKQHKAKDVGWTKTSRL
jgi:hypothetical protein